MSRCISHNTIRLHSFLNIFYLLFNFLSIEARIDQQEILSVYFPDGQVKDLISGGEFSIKDSFALRPYQSLWLCTN